MKILIAGSGEIWALEKFYHQHLIDAGIDVQLLPVQSIFYAYYNKSVLNKILYKVGLSKIGQVISSRLKQIVVEWKPDVVWVFKGMEISPEALRWIKQRNIKLVNYNPDNPFVFSGAGSGNKNITESIALYDLHLSYDRDTAKKIEQQYNIPCKILPFGYNLEESLYLECRHQQEIKKLCFVGNPDRQRVDFLTQLSKEVVIDVYGEAWSAEVKNSNISFFPAVYGDDFWKTLHRYRVQLNLMRIHNPTSHNMRSFEIPAIGGIGLFPATADHSYYFEPGQEVFLYGSLQECIHQAKGLLQMTDEEAMKIRLAARAKSIHAGYSYRDRALHALNEIRKMLV